MIHDSETVRHVDDWRSSPSMLSAALACLLLVAIGSSCESSQNRASSSNSSGEKSARSSESPPESNRKSAAEEDQSAPGLDAYREERLQMVREQIAGRDVDDPDVLAAMKKVPRHEFVLDRYEPRAYADRPLPIGHDQTISQPYIVGAMTEALQIEPDQTVLEIGTGSGYQAAILGELADSVYTIEIVCDLAERAKATLDEQGYENVHVKCGDGYEGWPEQAPFERIIVTAAPPKIPEALVDQLAPGGRMVLPVGDRRQELKVVVRREDGSVEKAKLMDVRFVPMVHGDAGE